MKDYQDETDVKDDSICEEYQNNKIANNFDTIINKEINTYQHKYTDYFSHH